MAKHIANERIRLTDLTKPWSLKRYFLNSLDDLERKLVEQISLDAPNDSVVREYDARHECPDQPDVMMTFEPVPEPVPAPPSGSATEQGQYE